MKTVLSMGLGVQTTALLVLCATGRWPKPDAILFSDTGAEHPDTYAYLSEVAQPYARANGMEITVIRESRETLYERSWRRRIVPSINTRWCTDQFKIRPINRWLRANGATAKDPYHVWIGISTDEAKRAKDGIPRRYLRRSYPLIELSVSRTDCRHIIREAGLRVPPKSGCWYCPLQSMGSWRHLIAEHPELAEQAVALELRAKERNPLDGLIGGRKSLYEFVRGGTQMALEGLDEWVEAEAGCVTGSCFV